MEGSQDLFKKLLASLSLEESADALRLSGTCPQCDHAIARSVAKKGTFSLALRDKSKQIEYSTSVIMACNCGLHAGAGCGFRAKVPLG